MYILRIPHYGEFLKKQNIDNQVKEIENLEKDFLENEEEGGGETEQKPAEEQKMTPIAPMTKTLTSSKFAFADVHYKRVRVEEIHGNPDSQLCLSKVHGEQWGEMEKVDG